jgi:hypothetical protein
MENFLCFAAILAFNSEDKAKKAESEKRERDRKQGIEVASNVFQCFF